MGIGDRPPEASRYGALAPRHPYRSQSVMDYQGLCKKALDGGLVNVTTIQVDTKKIREVLGCSRQTALVVKVSLDWYLAHSQVTVTPQDESAPG